MAVSGSESKTSATGVTPTATPTSPSAVRAELLRRFFDDRSLPELFELVKLLRVLPQPPGVPVTPFTFDTAATKHELITWLINNLPEDNPPNSQQLALAYAPYLTSLPALVSLVDTLADVYDKVMALAPPPSSPSPAATSLVAASSSSGDTPTPSSSGSSGSAVAVAGDAHDWLRTNRLQLRALQEELRAPAARLLVIGNGGSGKSQFINLLLRSQVCPNTQSDSASVLEIAYGDETKLYGVTKPKKVAKAVAEAVAAATAAEGASDSKSSSSGGGGGGGGGAGLSLAASAAAERTAIAAARDDLKVAFAADTNIADAVLPHLTHLTKKGNHKYNTIRLETKHPSLQAGLVLVHGPGLDNPDPKLRHALRHEYRKAAGFIIMINGREAKLSPTVAAEIEEIRRIAGVTAPLFFVVTRLDQLSESGAARTRRQLNLDIERLLTRAAAIPTATATATVTPTSPPAAVASVALSPSGARVESGGSGAPSADPWRYLHEINLALAYETATHAAPWSTPQCTALLRRLIDYVSASLAARINAGLSQFGAAQDLLSTHCRVRSGLEGDAARNVARVREEWKRAFASGTQHKRELQTSATAFLAGISTRLTERLKSKAEEESVQSFAAGLQLGEKDSDRTVDQYNQLVRAEIVTYLTRRCGEIVLEETEPIQGRLAALGNDAIRPELKTMHQLLKQLLDPRRVYGGEEKKTDTDTSDGDVSVELPPFHELITLNTLPSITFGLMRGWSEAEIKADPFKYKERCATILYDHMKKSAAAIVAEVIRGYQVSVDQFVNTLWVQLDQQLRHVQLEIEATVGTPTDQAKYRDYARQIEQLNAWLLRQDVIRAEDLTVTVAKPLLPMVLRSAQASRLYPAKLKNAEGAEVDVAAEHFDDPALAFAKSNVLMHLDHENIVRFYGSCARIGDGSDASPDALYLVQEFVRGFTAESSGTLDQLLRNDEDRDTFNPSHTLTAKIALDVAEALTHVFQRQFVLTDLSAASFLIERPGGRVVLTNVANARRFGEAGASPLDDVRAFGDVLWRLAFPERPVPEPAERDSKTFTFTVPPTLQDEKYAAVYAAVIRRCWAATTTAAQITSKFWTDICNEVRPGSTVTAAVAPKRVLCLDGGGIKGLSTIRILEAIQAKLGGDTKTIGSQFDLICGTSTGGILAMAVGILGLSLAECNTIYKTMAKDVFGSKRGAINMGITGNIQYGSEGIDKQLQKVFAARPLQTPADTPPTGTTGHTPKVFVVTKRLGLPAAFVVRSWAPPATPNFKLAAGASDWTMRDAGRATSAAPSYFPWFVRGGQYYMDGGVGFNNPAELAEQEVRALWGPQAARDMILVSVGTGSWGNTKAGEKLMWGFQRYSEIAWFASDLVSVISDAERVAQNMQTRFVPLDQYFRFNINLNASFDKEFAMDETKDVELNKLVDATTAYVNTREVQARLDALAAAFTRHESKTTASSASSSSSSSSSSSGAGATPSASH